MYGRTQPRIRFRDYEGSSGPIFNLKVATIVLSSSKDVLSQNFRSTKTKEVTGFNSPQIYFKAVVRRELAGAEGGRGVMPRVGHRVLFRSVRSVLFCS